MPCNLPVNLFSKTLPLKCIDMGLTWGRENHEPWEQAISTFSGDLVLTRSLQEMDFLLAELA